MKTVESSLMKSWNGTDFRRLLCWIPLSDVWMSNPGWRDGLLSEWIVVDSSSDGLWRVDYVQICWANISEVRYPAEVMFNHYWMSDEHERKCSAKPDVEFRMSDSCWNFCLNVNRWKKTESISLNVANLLNVVPACRFRFGNVLGSPVSSRPSCWSSNRPVFDRWSHLFVSPAAVSRPDSPTTYHMGHRALSCFAGRRHDIRELFGLLYWIVATLWRRSLLPAPNASFDIGRWLPLWRSPL